jgi:antirestriction protein ArdC
MHISALYESVTNRIIEEMKNGTVPWTKPWKSGKTFGVMPMNAATGRPYNGINIPLLWRAADVHGYPTHGWLTYKQAHAAGGQVRKGEKATTVVFTKKLHIKDKQTDEDKQIGMLRTFAVFNVAQIDGLPDKPTPELVDIGTSNVNQLVDGFIAATKADIRIGGNIACYVPSKDFVALPPMDAFVTIESFYATALHELGHWTAPKHRCDREASGRYGTQGYAAEELVAELTAAFLCAHLGIKGELRHTDYIANWIQLLTEYPRAMFAAASKASQAPDYLRKFSETDVTEAGDQ